MVHVNADDGFGHSIDYNCKAAVMMLLGLMVTTEIYNAVKGEGSTESKVVQDIRRPVKEDEE